MAWHRLTTNQLTSKGMADHPPRASPWGAHKGREWLGEGHGRLGEGHGRLLPIQNFVRWMHNGRSAENVFISKPCLSAKTPLKMRRMGS